MERWLIDDFGNALASGSDLSDRLGVPATQEAEDYAILNIGFVGITERTNSIHIRFRPDIISDRAVIALLQFLLYNPGRPVVISFFQDIWKIEHTPNARVANAFIAYTLETKQSAPDERRIRVAHSVRAEQRWVQAESFVRLAVAKGDEIGLHDALNSAFAGRWTMFDTDYQVGTTKIVARGWGYPPIDRVFRGSPDVNRLEDVSDTIYRQWVADMCLEVAMSQRARFDDVDAIVTWPRVGEMRTRYWRALVPIWAHGNLCRLLSASGNDSGIDLRPKRVEEVSDVLSRVGCGHP